MRLIDEFSELFRARASGVIEEVGTFGDLLWTPTGGDIDVHMKRHREDPAFTVKSDAHIVALARINDEIRFYAAPLDQNANEREIATVHDAVAFTVEYLGGAALDSIRVVRRKPDWA